MTASFLVWIVPAAALGLAIDAVLLRASSKWVLRRDIGFWLAAGTCGLIAAAALTIGLAESGLLAVLGQGGALSSALGVLALAGTLAAAGAIIARLLQTTFLRGLGVAAVKTVLTVAVFFAAGIPYLLFLR